MKKKKFNFVPYIIIFTVVALIVGGCFLWTYVIEDLIAKSKEQKLEYDASSGSYCNKKLDITYTPAPAYYQASAVITDPVYASSDKNNLYRVGVKTTDDDGNSKIKLCSASEWLSTDKEHGMRLYYNKEKVSPPSLSEFGADIVYFCTMTEVTIGQSSMEAELFFPDGFFDGECENLYGTDAQANSAPFRQIRVTSEKYEWMQLVLYLYKNDSADEYYIYLPQEELFVKADSETLSVFFAEVSSSGSGDAE